MKFSIFAALVSILIISEGSEAFALVKRDAEADVDKLTQLINDMSASVTTATQEMIEKIKALEMTNTAKTYMEDSRTQIQPLMEKVQAEAAKLQEQVQPYITNMEEHIKPLSAQVKPLTDMMENLFKQVMDQSKSLLTARST